MIVSSVCSSLKHPLQTWKLSSCYARWLALFHEPWVLHQLHSQQQNHRADGLGCKPEYKGQQRPSTLEESDLNISQSFSPNYLSVIYMCS